MAKHFKLIIIALLTLAMLIFPVSAFSVLPHILYGNVTIGSQSAPLGTHITATVTGGGANYTTKIIGEYGTEFMADFFLVQPDGEDSTIAIGAPITFFINGIQAEVYEVGKGSWQSTYPFDDGGFTNLDIRIGPEGPPTTIPTTAPTTIPTTTPTTSPTTAPTTSPIIVNQPPVAENDFYAVIQDSVFFVPAPGVLANDTDPNGDSLSAACISPPINGYLSLNPDGSFTYTPLPEWYGNVTFTYKANDGVADSNVAQVWIVVNAPTPTEYVINATIVGDGNITPSGEVTVQSGYDQSFNVQTSPQKSWLTALTIDNTTIAGDGILGAETLVVTFKNVLSNHTIYAEFISPPEPPK